MYSVENSGLVLGSNVDILRTDGRVHSAIISHINDNTNSITVEWFEKGEAKGKEIEIESVYQLNPNLRPKKASNACLLNMDSDYHSRDSSSPKIFQPKPHINSTKASNNVCKLPNKNSKIIDELILQSPCNSHKACSNGDISGRNSVQSIMSSKTQNKGKNILPKENNRHPIKKNLKRPPFKFHLDQTEIDPSDPNCEFRIMIREFQLNLQYSLPVTDPPAGDHRICVCVRKRPLNRREILRKDVDVISIPNKQMVIVHEPRLKVDLTKYLENQSFRFDYAFDDHSDNMTVYHYTAKPLVESIFERGMATCFAYGQTGSGKTHTMGGDFETTCYQDITKGIYGLAARDIFKLVNTKYRKENLIVEASFFEIYGGKVFDLLNKKQKLRVLEDQHGTVQIVGLKEEMVGSVDDVLKLIEVGMNIRTSGQTSANQHSSRSHAVLQLILKKKMTKMLHGKFSLIDLAGNERGADTSSSDRNTRMEGAEINKSLLALKECIRALGRKGSHLPFRASKLTHVLRDSFIGDNSRTCMIAMISPGMSSCEHTLNTLRYADRVKELVPSKPNTAGANSQPPALPSSRQTRQSQYQRYEEDLTNHCQRPSPSIIQQKINADKLNELKSNGSRRNISAGDCGRSNGQNKDYHDTSKDIHRFDAKITSNSKCLREIIHEHTTLIENIPNWLSDHRNLFSKLTQSTCGYENYVYQLESLVLKNIGKLSALKMRLSKVTNEIKPTDSSVKSAASNSKLRKNHY